MRHVQQDIRGLPFGEAIASQLLSLAVRTRSNNRAARRLPKKTMRNATARIPTQIRSQKINGRLLTGSTVMSVQGVQRSNHHLPRYDALEILMIAAGVVF